MSRFRPPARAIILSGFMGTGKTVVGRLLAERWDLEWVETDAVIEQQEGTSIAQIFATHGEQYFRDRETAALREVLRQEGLVLSTGGGMLLRAENVELLQAAGPIVCLRASPETIVERTSATAERPLLDKPDPLAEIKRLLAAREEAYQQADYHLDTDNLTPEDAADRCEQMLATDPRAIFLLPRPVQVQVALGPESYLIHIGAGLLSETGCLFPSPQPARRAGIITTENLVDLYAQSLQDSLADARWEVNLFPVPDGESSKSLHTAELLYADLLDADFDRSSTIFALGGGMVGDLAGFVAATFMRGIDLVQVPTSLLAQVDASVGGKVAVNLPAGKNLVGAFHQPQAVIIDLQTLPTLPQPQFRGGLAEVIKHAAIADAEMFEYLEDNIAGVLAGDRVALKYLLARNCQIKAEVVSQDPHEQGQRVVLNYGHTIGHALERAAEQWEMGHGEAVALGMIAESRLAVELGLAEPQSAQRLRELVQAAGLPTTASGIDLQRAARALSVDKKISAGRLRLPIVPQIGEVQITEQVQLSTLQQAITSLSD